jgi:DNA-binding FadR family transcriptional regulator
MASGPDSGARRPLTDEVAERIQARILDGTFGPGDRLPTERELALELRVNRGSVREALKKLEQLRLIRIQQGSGIRVCNLEEASFDLVRSVVFQGGEISRDWLADLLELCEALLPPVVKLGLERAGADERERAALLLRRAGDPGLPPAEFVQTLREIWTELARMSRNRVLIMLFHSVARLLVGPLPDELIELLASERRRLVPLLRRLALAIEAGDGKTAERTMRDFVRRMTAAVLAAVDA